MTGDETAGGAMPRESLHDWLMSDRPRSRRQASLGRAYGAWRTFARNRLAMLGLAIVIGLVLTAVFAVPFLVVALTPERLPLPALVAAVLIWLLAVGGETLADRQLAAWRADPAHRGRTCRAGLWRYSRHPNYFFEWLHWWSYPLLAWGSPEWWLTLLGPALMLYTLLKVTGIPYTEQQALASRGDDYRAYQRTTSAFVPWFPKQEG